MPNIFNKLLQTAEKEAPLAEQYFKPTPAQESANVFQSAPPRAAESAAAFENMPMPSADADAVLKQYMQPGNSAADSAQVFSGMPNTAAESAAAFQNAPNSIQLGAPQVQNSGRWQDAQWKARQAAEGSANSTPITGYAGNDAPMPSSFEGGMQKAGGQSSPISSAAGEVPEAALASMEKPGMQYDNNGNRLSGSSEPGASLSDAYANDLNGGMSGAAFSPEKREASFLKKLGLGAAGIGGLYTAGAMMNGGGTPGSVAASELPPTQQQTQPDLAQKQAMESSKHMGAAAPSMPGMQKSAPLTLDLSGATGGAGPDALKQAMAQRDQDLGMSAALQGAQQIGRGLSGIGGARELAPEIQNAGAEMLAKNANNALTDYSAKVEAQKNDPNSQISKFYQGVLNKFGVKIKGPVSAADVEKVMPNLIKAKEMEEARSQHLTEKKYQYDMLNFQKQQQHALDEEKRKEKNGGQMLSDLERFRGNKALQQAAADTLSGAKALDMISGMTDKELDQLDSQQGHKLLSEVMKIATGGVPHSAEMKAQMPANLQNKLSQAASFFTSEPTPAKQGKYIRENANYLKQMMNTSQDVLDKYQARTLFGKSHLVDSNSYQKALDLYPGAANYISKWEAAKQGGGIPSSASAMNAAQNPTVAAFAAAKKIPYAQAQAILQERAKAASGNQASNIMDSLEQQKKGQY